MSEFDKELEESLQDHVTPSEETPETSSEVKTEEVQGTEQVQTEGKEQPSTPETVVTLLGRQYDLSKPDQVQELAKDYDRLGRQYAPIVQQVRDLQARLEELQKKSSTPDIEDPETREYLKKLGVVFLDELQQREEQERLEDYLTSLEAEYDGSDGRPKFDRVEALQYCIQSFQNGNGIITDPLKAYKEIHEKELLEWEIRNRLKNTQTPPPSNKGSSGANIPKAKKVTFGVPESEDEIDLRSAMTNTLNEMETKLGE